jgi:hypothetical protein
MANDEFTTAGRSRGALLKFREICALCKCGASTMRALIRTGKGPPVFKRPGGGQHLAFENEVRAWLVSARAAPPSTAGEARTRARKGKGA